MLQAKSFMPDVRIHLITDRKFKSRSVKTHDLGNYMKSADDFEKKYVHRSSNSYDFELFCFQRWFILKDFVIENKFEKPFLYLDSDVFLYSNFFKSLDLQDHKMTVTGGFWPQYSYFKNQRSIIDFSQFINDYFVLEEQKRYLDEWYKNRFIKLKERGGVCDMTLLGLYSSNCLDLFETKEGYFNTSLDSISDDAIKKGFDANSFNLKHFSFENNDARIAGIKVHALHFQAGAKILAVKYYRGRYRRIVNLYGFFCLKKFSVIRKFKRLIKKK